MTNYCQAHVLASYLSQLCIVGVSSFNYQKMEMRIGRRKGRRKLARRDYLEVFDGQSSSALRADQPVARVNVACGADREHFRGREGGAALRERYGMKASKAGNHARHRVARRFRLR